MNIKLLAVRKTEDKNLLTLIEQYQKKISFYVKFQMEIITDIKNTKKLSEHEQKLQEGIAILSKITPLDDLVLFDQNGKMFSSIGFSDFLQKKMNASTKSLIFVIGGPYGFSDLVYNRANSKISLSPMTFSHQMVRLFAIEQLYRGFTILNNQPYHHQ